MWLHQYYIVSAVQSRHASVINVMGDTVLKSGRYDSVIAKTIDLDTGVFHCDFQATVIPDIRKAYGPDVTIEVWYEEGLFTLSTNRDDLSLADVMREFKLESLSGYLARNRALQDAIRAGREAPDLTPPYLGWRQW